MSSNLHILGQISQYVQELCELKEKDLKYIFRKEVRMNCEENCKCCRDITPGYLIKHIILRRFEDRMIKKDQEFNTLEALFEKV